jgi:hypothetical protein
MGRDRQLLWDAFKAQKGLKLEGKAALLIC